MKRSLSLLLLGAASVLVLPCVPALAAEDTVPNAATPAPSPTPEKPADNTARNTRDRDDARLDPLDQGNSAADVELTARIRQALTRRDDLSTNAKNIKVITRKGAVTLRGPVKDQAEKLGVEEIARRIAGTDRVTSELEPLVR